MKIIFVLMQLALMGQVLALQAVGSRVVQCDSSQLEQARRAFRANDLSLAEGLTEALMSCPGPLGEEASSFWNEIKTRRHNERLWQRAQLLIRQSELEPACQLLYEIEATSPHFPNLQAARESASCNPALEQLGRDLDGIDDRIKAGLWEEAGKMLDGLSEEHTERGEVRERKTVVEAALDQARLEAAAADYRKSVALFDRGDLDGARTRLQRVLRNHQNHREARALLSQVKGQLANEEKSKTVSQLSEEVRELMEDGDLSAALEKTREALTLDESSTEILWLQEEIEGTLKREETELREALESFYTGQYREAADRLRGYLEERHRPRFGATASFFLGASLVSVSLRSQEETPADLDAAREYFKESRQTDPEFVAPLEFVSPKVRAVFAEATLVP